ncbi:MAG: hypothetical protein KA184_01865 [Candidatus Hydrogenedentes bacterium]|nr:hypothetical protein [Candidatus Hydrogenedentota bacterium]
MLCLGINEDFFDAGVALCDGPNVLFAANEERYTRRKDEGGFPRLALHGLFEYTGIECSAVERIYISGIMTPPLPIRMLPFLHAWRFKVQRRKSDTLARRLMDFAAYATPLSHTSEEANARRWVRRLLPWAARRALPRELRHKPIIHVDHHRAHAAGAWCLSGFETALAVTADGMGDGVSLTVSRCTPEKGVDRLWAASSLDSFGLFFEALCEGCGFMPCRDEGKITGLAACGDPRRVTEPDPFQLTEGRLRYAGPHGRRGVAWARDTLLRRYSREDVCAWAQFLLESHLTEVARWWLRETGENRLVVAGGVFGNVKLNQRLHQLPEVERLFVYPNMGDGGLSLGAICLGERLAPSAARNVFWGEDYPDTTLEQALRDSGLPFKRVSEPEARTADLLNAGHIVARYTGRMEWGPRALGNRSILVRTTDRVVVDRLNTALRRSDFMPFAPALLAEDAPLYCDSVEPARHSAEFMTVCFNCTDRMKAEHPAVVHVDGTARAQFVRAEANPTFHRVLTAYKRLSGSSVVLNTSFNIHEEPIVRTPAEAVAAFRSARLDYLVLGPFLASSQHPLP